MVSMPSMPALQIDDGDGGRAGRVDVLVPECDEFFARADVCFHLDLDRGRAWSPWPPGWSLVIGQKYGNHVLSQRMKSEPPVAERGVQGGADGVEALGQAPQAGWFGRVSVLYAVVAQGDTGRTEDQPGLSAVECLTMLVVPSRTTHAAASCSAEGMAEGDPRRSARSLRI